MQLAIIGPTGFVGSGLLAGALDRGRDITAIVPDPRGRPDLSAAWTGGAHRSAAFLDASHGESERSGTFVRPAAHLAPGERTGGYPVGGDRRVTGPDGERRTSIPDDAIASLDEVESGAHPRQRVSVA